MTVATGERHGYGIMLDIAERTGGAVRLEAGGLYRSIRRLIGDKLLTESPRRPAADLDDERRRYYALTPLGKRVLAAEVLSMSWSSCICPLKSPPTIKLPAASVATAVAY